MRTRTWLVAVCLSVASLVFYPAVADAAGVKPPMPKKYDQVISAVAQEYKIDLNAPARDMTPEQRNLVLYGTHGQEVTLHYRNKDGRQATWRTAFEGVINNLQRRYNETAPSICARESHCS